MSTFSYPSFSLKNAACSASSTGLNDEMARKRQIMTISEEELAENEGSEEE